MSFTAKLLSKEPVALYRTIGGEFSSFSYETAQVLSLYGGTKALQLFCRDAAKQEAEPSPLNLTCC